MQQRRSKRTEKLQIMLSDEELQAIDDWRFEHRLPTRAAAIRELLKRGLMSDPDPSETPDERTPSTEIGVID